MDILKCTGEMSFLEGHVADCSGSCLGGWFAGHVSYFEFERYDPLFSLFEADLKHRNFVIQHHDIVDRYIQEINIKVACYFDAVYFTYFLLHIWSN